MKLINAIKKVILEQLDDMEDVDKLFGYDIYSIFDYYKKNDQLDELLSLFDEDNYLRIIPPLVDSGHKPYEDLAFDLVSRDMVDIHKEGDRYFLHLESDDELKELFSKQAYRNDIDCYEVADQIFSDEGLDWEPYDLSSNIHDIIEDVMSDKTYEDLITFVLENYSNKEVSCGREEFEHWVEGDKLSDMEDGFILTPDRILSVAKGKEDMSKYNFAILLECLGDVGDSIRWTFDRAYNDILQGEYYNSYIDAVREILPQGKDVQVGSRTALNKQRERIEVPNWVHQIDITDQFWNVIKEWEKYANPYLEEGSWFQTLVTVMKDNDYNGGLLCPQVDEWPDDTDVENHFNDIFIEELKWRTE
jgi:hypothetical protein